MEQLACEIKFLRVVVRRMRGKFRRTAGVQVKWEVDMKEDRWKMAQHGQKVV